MKSILVACFILIQTTLLFAQHKLENIIKVGSKLFYRIDVNDKHYDLTATVTRLDPVSFSWQIKDSANASGNITHTRKAFKRANSIQTKFIGGNTLLSKSTNLWLSKKLFRHFTSKNGKPTHIRLKGEDGEAINMGTYTGNNDLEITINGATQTIKEELAKPLVKMAGKYIPTGDELLAFYNSSKLPLILRIRADYYMQLIAVSSQ
jgi:hypothetical protein